ncbi:MAG: MFS transporter [Gordonibacter sp.]|uniref:MFS transporter n=1 Tax=Gordonibacter sp. TaxID=1968902 RepID=UPI002FCBE8ED
MTVEEKRAEINQTGRAWVVAIIAIIASILISANSNKLPATMSLVIPALGIDTGTAGNIMSLNGYVGFVLAFVAASIIMKFGTKKTTLMVLGCAVVGAVISAFATDYIGLVVGRLIEGVGYACIGTVIPVLFSEWFPPSKRGVPMGIFSVWVPLGSMFIMGTSGFFFNQGDPTSYHAVFWFVVALLAVVTVVWAVAVRNPQVSYLEQESGANAEKPKVSEGFKSLSCWVAMLAFAAFALGTACVMNFETLYMVQTMGMDQASANGMLNVANIAVVVGGIGIGFVMNVVKSNGGRLAILVGAAAVLGACFALAYTVSGALLVPWLIVFGVSNGIVPAIFFTMVAEIAPRPALASVSSTLMSCGQCVGGILFGIVGAVVATAGWAACTGLLTGVGIVLFLGALALFLVLRARDKKRVANTVQ